MTSTWTSNAGIGSTFTTPFTFPVFALAVDSSSNIFWSTNNAIYYSSPPYSSQTLVSGTAGSSGFSEGIASIARFTTIYSMCLNSNSTILYAMDSANYAVRKITNPMGSSFTSTIAGGRGSGNVYGTSTSSSFGDSYAICLDTSESNVYFSDTTNNAVKVLNVNTTLLSKVVGGGNDQILNLLILSSAASFAGMSQNIRTMKYTSSGNLYLAVRPGGNPNFAIIYLNNGSNVSYFNDPIASTGYPQFAVTSDEAIFHSLPSATSAAINTYGISWTIENLAGTGASGSNNGPGNVATFNQPRYLAYSSLTSNILVADTQNSLIRRIAPDGVNTVSTLPIVKAETVAVSNPQTISLYSNSLYTVLNSGATSAIARIPLTTYPTTTFTFSNVIANTYQDVAYTYGRLGLINGTLETAAFNFTSSYCGLCIDSNTNTMYVGDSDNFVIRKISNGIVTTIAGNGLNLSVDSNVGSNASFKDISTLALNSTGTILYAGGFNEAKIRIIDLRPGSNFAVSSSTVSYRYTSGICVDPTDTFIYYANYDQGVISKIRISTWAIDSNYSKAGVFTFNLCINKAGTLLYYSTLGGQNRIGRLDLTTSLHTTVVGDGATAYPADGPGLSIKLMYPRNLTLDTSESNLYFAIDYNYEFPAAVRRVELTSGNNNVTTISGNYTYSIGSTFSNYPLGIIYNPFDNFIYYIDRIGNNITRIINTPKSTQIQNATGRQLTIAVPNATVSNSNLNSVLGLSDVKTLYSRSEINYTLL